MPTGRFLFLVVVLTSPNAITIDRETMMKGHKKKAAKKSTRNRKLMRGILLLAIIGVIGGVLIKLGYYERLTDNIMSNAEANRLISYLGINDYEYTDRLGSSFTVKAAKELAEAAGVSEDQITGAWKHWPGFIPITKRQFQSVYDMLIEQLELDRLYRTSLYIYDIDSANDKEINGILYEVISTSSGDYYMEKNYGLSVSYIGMVADFYVSNNEIILCLGESSDTITVYNAYVDKVLEEGGNQLLLTYISGGTQKFAVSKNYSVEEKMSGCLCDLALSNDGVTAISDHTAELKSAKVTSLADGVLTIEGYEEPVYLSDVFNVYKVKGTIKAMQSAGTLIGYDQVSLYIKDGLLEAALITEDIASKNIRVLISDNNYTTYYHNTVLITSDTDFTVTFGENVTEYSANEILTFREELANGNARIASKEEDGKITINSIERQSGNPSYRGTIELSRTDQGILIVNDLSVEDYLYGVVPSEMPVSYEMEALKAQAICARAYAYRQMESDTYSQYGAHLDDSIYSQVYNNVEEDDRAIYAVDDTYGVVPCYDNQVIEAFFFSTSCGTTSNNSAVWGGVQEPYLLDTMETELNDIANLSNEASFQNFIDGYLGNGFIEAEEPFFRWEVHMTKEEMQQTINSNLYDRIEAMSENIKVKNAKGLFEKKAISGIGDLQSIEVSKRGDSGIIEEVLITGSEETVLVIGQTNARALFCPKDVTIKKQDGSVVTGWTSLPSAYYYIDLTDGYTLRGGGFGHGVGMSQNGANDMAKMGYSARDIIEHYYTSVELKDMYELMGR